MTAARADAGLQQASPAAGEDVSVPLTEVVLTFGDDLLTIEGATSGVIEVRDPMGMLVSDGEVVVEGPVMRTGVAPVANGEYTAAWQTVGADGHTVSDEYTFRYLAGEEDAQAAQSSTLPDDRSSERLRPDGSDDFPLWVIVLLALVALAVVGLVIVVVRRARRSRTDGDATGPE